MKKVKIYTVAFNRPEFIPLQQESLLKYIKDDFEVLVLNNSVGNKHDFKIKEVCEKSGIRCIDVVVRNPIAGAWIGHSNALNWAFHNFIKIDANTIAMVMDHDIFVINEFSVNNYVKDYDVMALPNHSGNLIFPQPIIMLFNIDSLPNKDDINFAGGQVEGIHTDTGGHLWYWLKDHPNLRINYLPAETVVLDYVGIVPEDIIKKYGYMDIKTFTVIDKLFLHYMHASNYCGFEEDYYGWKTTILTHFLASE
jgi:hypothetical protein